MTLRLSKLFDKPLLPLCLLMCGCAWLPAATAELRKQTYYVDAVNGTDTNSGLSPHLAWKSMAAVNAHEFHSGNHILFHSGQAFGGEMIPTGSGNAGAPILVGRYASGSLPLLVGDHGVATIDLKDVSYWTIENLEITNDAPNEGKRDGLLIEATRSGETVRDITIQHVSIHNVRGMTGEQNSAKDTGGIGIFAPELDRPAKFDGINIEGCTIAHVDNVGIWLNTYPLLNPRDQRWNSASSEHIRVVGNHISDTGRNAIIVRESLAPLIEGNTVTHSSSRHHGNAIFTRSTVDAVIRGNEVSYTGTEPSGENAAFDADIDSLGTIIEDNWSHDNQGGLFSLCNNPADDENVTDGTVVRFNVSENDGNRVFGFSGGVTNTLVYNNTVFIGSHRSTALIETRPFSKSKPRFANGAQFFNNLVIIAGNTFYDMRDASGMQFDANCHVGNSMTAAADETRLKTIGDVSSVPVVPARTMSQLRLYRRAAEKCGASPHAEPEGGRMDILHSVVAAGGFYGAVRP